MEKVEKKFIDNVKKLKMIKNSNKRGSNYIENVRKANIELKETVVQMEKTKKIYERYESNKEKKRINNINFNIVSENTMDIYHISSNRYIPRIINVIWYQGYNDLSDKYVINLEKICEMNKNFKVNFWDEKSIRMLVSMYYKDDVFNSFDKIIKKVDYGKYLIVYNTGGIYLDLDVNVLRPFDNVLTHMENIGVKTLFSKEIINQLKINKKSEMYHDLLRDEIKEEFIDIDIIKNNIISNHFFVSFSRNKYLSDIISLCRNRVSVMSSCGPYITSYIYWKKYSKDKTIYIEDTGLFDGILKVENKYIVHVRDCKWCIKSKLGKVWFH